MRSNRRRDTKPELAVRRQLHARGLRYRVDLALDFDRRRRADIVFPRARLVVFVDGCFWHGCPVHYTIPAAHAEFWADKRTRNVIRDADTTARLEAEGWHVMRFWEHQSPSEIADVIAEAYGRLRAIRSSVRTPSPRSRDGADSLAEADPMEGRPPQ